MVVKVVSCKSIAIHLIKCCKCLLVCCYAVARVFAIVAMGVIKSSDWFLAHCSAVASADQVVVLWFLRYSELIMLMHF